MVEGSFQHIIFGWGLTQACSSKQPSDLGGSEPDIDVEIAKAFVLRYVGEHESAQLSSCYRDFDRSPPPYRTVQAIRTARYNQHSKLALAHV